MLRNLGPKLGRFQKFASLVFLGRPPGQVLAIGGVLGQVLGVLGQALRDLGLKLGRAGQERCLYVGEVLVSRRERH